MVIMSVVRRVGVISSSLVSAALLLGPGTSRAQAPTTPAPAAPAPVAAPRGAQPTAAAPRQPTEAERDEARTRFTRALELAEDGSLDAALEELKRAYALAPSYRILYNIGLVYQSLQDYGRALDAFEQYLDEGGAEIPADRVAEVNSRLERLKGRVGYLEIRANEPTVAISVDDLPVGETPLASKLRVKSGRRKVTATISGRQPSTQVIELAGGETRVVTFDLHLAAPVLVKEPPKSPVPWICWGITAALAGAATTTGVLALNAASDYDDVRGQFNPNAAAQKSALESADSKAAGFALATDILIGAAAVSAGVSIYFTIRPPKTSAKADKGERVSLVPTGRGAGLRYSF